MANDFDFADRGLSKSPALSDAPSRHLQRNATERKRLQGLNLSRTSTTNSSASTLLPYFILICQLSK